MHPRDEEKKRERREPGEVDQHLHQSEEDVVVLLVKAVPHVEWGIPLAVNLEREPQPRRKIGGSHLGGCLKAVAVSFLIVNIVYST